MQHFLEKWDSYLGKLLGIIVIIIAIIKPGDSPLLLYFRYFLFLMIGVALFDIVSNFGQHESKFWHFIAVISNLFSITACIFLLQNVARFQLPLQLPELWIFSIPNFILYLGIFIFLENSMWTYVYDHL